MRTHNYTPHIERATSLPKHYKSCMREFRKQGYTYVSESGEREEGEGEGEGEGKGENLTGREECIQI